MGPAPTGQMLAPDLSSGKAARRGSAKISPTDLLGATWGLPQCHKLKTSMGHNTGNNRAKCGADRVSGAGQASRREPEMRAA